MEILEPFRYWSWDTGGGLAARVAVCVFALVALAAIDLRRHGRQARRWREYVFLLAITGAAMAYGVINDQVTVTISPEYFLYGKGLVQRVGESPAVAALRWEAFKLGLMATWWVGLIGGAIMLLANSLPKRWPILRDRRLYAMLLLPLGGAVVLAVASGLVQWIAVASGWWGSGFESIINDSARNTRFACVWGIHLGGYVGAAFGGLMAAAQIVRLRRRLAVG